MTQVLRSLPILLIFLVNVITCRAEFVLRDGDTVAFLGDSITAARGYTKTVEHYTLMRFPERNVRFVNAGKGGDTTSGCVDRLERDVFSKGPTVVTVVFGVNDIGWGMKADDEHKQRYLDGIRNIIEQCKARKIRAIICSPAITAETPDKAESGFLQHMTDEGLALAKSLGAETIDLQRGMRKIQRRIVEANAAEKDKAKHTLLHVGDGVHLNELGHLAMAYAMLKGLGAPEDVSSVVLDAKNEVATSAKGCTISDVKPNSAGIDFTRLDQGLPLNLGFLSGFTYRWIPIPEGISRYMLTVENLPSGEYEIRAEGRSLGKVNAAVLAHGLNIFSMTADGWEPGGPWDAQSNAVRELVDARDKVWMSGFVRAHFLANHPQNTDLEKKTQRLDDELVTLQHAIAKPYPYHFEIRKVERIPEAGVAPIKK